MATFRESKSFEERKQQADELLEKHLQRRPVIIERHAIETKLPKLEDETLWILPEDITMAQFQYMVGKKLELSQELIPTILLVTGSEKRIQPVMSATIGAVYVEHKDEDGFLYFIYKSFF